MFAKCIKETTHHLTYVFQMSFLYVGIQLAHMGLSFDLLNITQNAILTLLFGSILCAPCVNLSRKEFQTKHLHDIHNVTQIADSFFFLILIQWNAKPKLKKKKKHITKHKAL